MRCRSGGLGSILAWILNTNPLNASSSAASSRFPRLNRARRRGDFHETVEKLLHAERVERGAEEYRCDFSVQICLFVEVGIYALNQFEVFAELVCVGFPDKLIHLRGRHIGYLNALRHGLLRRGEEVEPMFVDVVDSFELRPHVDRP